MVDLSAEEHPRWQVNRVQIRAISVDKMFGSMN